MDEETSAIPVKKLRAIRFIEQQVLDVPREVRLLLAMQFLMNLSTFTAMPLMAVYMTSHLGLSATVLGTVFTIHLAMGRALPIVTGPLVDRFGFRNMMVLGLLVRAGGFWYFSFGHDAFSIICATVFIGLGTSGYESALYGIFGRQPDAIVTRVFILNNFALNLGVVVGPSLGALLVATDVLMPFRIAAVFFAALGLFSFSLGRLDKKYASRSAITDSWKKVFSDLRFMSFLAVTFPWWVLFAQLFVAFPLLATQIDGRETAANMVFIANGVSGLVFVVGSLVVFKWVSALRMTLYCYTGLSLLYLLGIGAGTLPMLLAIVFAYTIAETMILPAIETITAELAPDGSQSTYFGALGLMWGAGMAVGSYMGSWLVLDLKISGVTWLVYSLIAATGAVGTILYAKAFIRN
ncbi:MFS transporter [Agrobacterium pusense]|uniref:MFS transporter n=1 Tax=Agrobacterium pusense TaxID=648995 RepID=A0AA44IX90_9HYPH|nr:MFS transporter [Agrobacterium pusense]MDH2092485.1 MFS transporter [Agrobacterium pusense]NRF07757.1 MFS transporter [Agrobacterium pusense]NRF18054.1 MFS transporter [Agrobacterium pusense]